tara:strand:+ start:48 stop:1796 length:1749 start_codon:yes stop_codon:yes gene_type:complete
MIESLNKVLYLLTLNQKRNSALFLFLLFFSTALEGVSLALIFPLIKIIMDKEYLLDLDTKINFINIANIGEEKIIIFTLLMVISIYFLKSAYLIFFSWWKSKFILQINNSISKRLFKKYINSPYSYFFNKNSSEFIRNVYGEARFINTFIDAVLKIFVETFSIIIILIVLFTINFKITFLTLILFGSFAIIFNFIFSNKIKNLSFKKQKYVAQTFQNMQQSFGSIKEIIMRGNQKFFSNNFNLSLTNVNLVAQFLMFISELPKNIIEVISVSIVCLIVFIGYENSKDFNVLIPTIALFGVASIRIMPAFNRLITNKQHIDSCYPSIRIIFDELKVEKDQISNQILKRDNDFDYKFENKISFENISFKYQNADSQIINNLNFSIKKNECVCFIGESGSGKTTLIDIISGLLTPDSGKIKLDDKEVSLSSHGWRKHVGYVSQSTYLIDDTIKNNILFGLNDDNSFDDQKFKKALRFSQLDKFIENLPDGTNYIVGENGVKLSGGQKQRIGIARALYFNPKILVLDEITSSLDDQTSQELLDSLNFLSGKITIIYISHNQKVIKNADIVFKLLKGEGGKSILKQK